MSVKRAGEWFTELPKQLNAKQNEIAVRVLKEIRDRLKFLVDVGLEYLTLARGSGTLSGGESQRIRLASQIGSGLTGVLYVLDEPSIGLHQRDNARLLETLKRLRDLGNTVIVVEHDEDAIRTADHVLDIGPGAGIHGGEIIAQGQVDDLIGNAELDHRQISLRRAGGADPRAAAEEHAPRAQGRQRARQQPEERHRRNPARPVHLRHRRLRRRQVDAADRHALQGDGAQDQRRQRSPRPARPHRGPRAPRQDHRHRPVADRPHAALQPRDLHRRLHADPRVVRRPAGGEGARLRARPLLVQRQGRPLRGLPGRRRHQDRDALPARRLRHLRRLQGQALQPRDARGAVQGQVDRRRARHDGRGGAGVLQGGAARARHAGAAAPRRPRLHPRRPAGHDAVGRRGAARQARQGIVQARHRPHALHPRRADHRPAFPRRGEAARGAARADRPGQHRGGDRAQSRSDQDRRLDHRPRPRGRRRRRRDRRAGHARGCGQGEAELHRAVPEAGAGAEGRARPGEEADRGGGVT